MSNIYSEHRYLFLLSVAVITSVLSGLPAQAETIDTSTTNNQQIISNEQQFNTDRSLADETSSIPNSAQVITEKETQSSIKFESEAKPLPIPGTTETSASVLLGQPTTTRKPLAKRKTATRNTNEVAQFRDVEPGRNNPSGSNYVGIGGNLGIAGGLAVGDPGFSLFAKIGLSREISVRPALVVNNDFEVLLPLTYDFRIGDTPFYPFVGGGLLITTASGTLGGLFTAGLDFPLSQQFTATGRFNLGFTGKEAGFGLIFGLAYNFGRGFTF